MFKNLKPMMISLGLAAFLTGAATAQGVGGYSHVEQQRITNQERGVANPYIYNNNARYNNNGQYYYDNNNRRYNRNNRNVRTRYYNDNNNNYRYQNNSGYYNQNGYYNNNDNGRAVQVGPLRIKI